MTTHQPRVITKSDPSRLEIEWADGHATVFAAWELRALCPCAMCVDELTGVRKHDPASVSTTLTTVGVSLVGNYALAIGFSDGHQTGIFTFRMMRARDPAGRAEAPPGGPAGTAPEQAGSPGGD